VASTSAIRTGSSAASLPLQVRSRWGERVLSWVFTKGNRGNQGWRWFKNLRYLRFLLLIFLSRPLARENFRSSTAGCQTKAVVAGVGDPGRECAIGQSPIARNRLDPRAKDLLLIQR